MSWWMAAEVRRGDVMANTGATPQWHVEIMAARGEGCITDSPRCRCEEL